MRKRITVFGGARIGEMDYEQALLLGRLLGQAGCTVLTGGYIGSMEAVSRGAAESGGHVIGVTCDEIEAWRPVHPNAWVQEEQRYPTIRERMFALIEGCDAAIALPGGPGTLAEVTVMWTLLLTAAIPPRPLILVGQGWRTAFEGLFASMGAYMPKDQGAWLSFAPDVQTAARMI